MTSVLKSFPDVSVPCQLEIGPTLEQYSTLSRSLSHLPLSLNLVQGHPEFGDHLHIQSSEGLTKLLTKQPASLDILGRLLIASNTAST